MMNRGKAGGPHTEKRLEPIIPVDLDDPRRARAHSHPSMTKATRPQARPAIAIIKSASEQSAPTPKMTRSCIPANTGASLTTNMWKINVGSNPHSRLSNIYRQHPQVAHRSNRRH